MVVIYRERNCAENYAKFCLENGQICETGRLLGAHTLASFLHRAILSSEYEWSGSGTNTRLRTWLTPPQ